MAANWTICRDTLFGDPNTVSIGVDTTLDPDHVVGKLMRVWLWAGMHTATGFVPGATLDTIDLAAAHKNFGAAMAKVEWIRVDSKGVRFVRWGKFNAKCWKQREKERKKKDKQRNNVPGDIPRDIPRDISPYSKSNSNEQTVTGIAKCSIAAAAFAPGGNACSLLAAVGLDDGAIRTLLSRGGVDDCLVEWAVGRLKTELAKERKGGKKIGNPPGFVRSLIESGKMPRSERDAWQRRRLAREAHAMNGHAPRPADAGGKA